MNQINDSGHETRCPRIQRENVNMSRNPEHIIKDQVRKMAEFIYRTYIEVRQDERYGAMEYTMRLGEDTSIKVYVAGPTAPDSFAEHVDEYRESIDDICIRAIRDHFFPNLGENLSRLKDGKEG